MHATAALDLAAAASAAPGLLAFLPPADAEPTCDQLLAAVSRPLMARGNHEGLDLAEFLASPLGVRLAHAVAAGRKLSFLLPAFPAKSANRDKTHGPAPDLGELLALCNLDRMCAEIEAVHPAGAEVVICSDGRVFNDLVMVSDADLELYGRRLAQMIAAEGLTHLRSFSLDDCGSLLDPARLREDLVETFGPGIDEIRAAAKADPAQAAMIDGIHRFMREDLAALQPDLSKTQQKARSRELAYQVVQRSRSWDNLLETVFPEALRLSIHPYPIRHRKFGVKLVAGLDRWGTPWHNVTVRVGGEFRLMKRREALALGATLEFHGGELAFYALP